MIAHVVVCRAVKGIAPAFGSSTYLDGAGAVLGSIITGLDSHLLDHVRVCGYGASVIRAEVHHSRAVNRHVVFFASQTIHVIRGTVVGAGEEPSLLKSGVVGSNHAG